MSKVIAIVGPTAVGKSALAVQLAKKLNGEIINGDSVSVYKELNIGSAKVTPSEMEGIPHYLVDYKNVEENYDVATFQHDGREAIAKILEKKKVPIIVGGTGLYIKALLYDYCFAEMSVPSTSQYDDLSNEQLYQLLQTKDSQSAEKIHPNNRKRVIRALQISESGTNKSELEAKQEHKEIYDSFIIGLTLDREQLRNRIDLRVDKMIQAGLTEEVKNLFAHYGVDHHCFTAIGYKEYIEYFNGNQTLEETIELIKNHTKQFAKRQYTWFRNQLPVHWFDITSQNFKNEVEEQVENFLQEN